LNTPTLTPTQVAKILSVSTATVYKLIAEGELKAVRIGPKLLRIEKHELDHLLKGQDE
jgi:excisionase family DNA binding protein